MSVESWGIMAVRKHLQRLLNQTNVSEHSFMAGPAGVARPHSA